MSRKDLKRLVVKIGSNILASGDQGLEAGTIDRLAGEISAITFRGVQVLVVSSGAVAAGMKKLGMQRKPREVRLKQAAAAVGQSSLMWSYEKAFSKHGKKVAQVLLTRDDFSDREKYINAKNTLLTLLSYGVIPIINENDTVATEEIRFGDNDNLAALVAMLIEAERLAILSDVEGLYSVDPRKDQAAELISRVEEITPDIEQTAGSVGSAVGTGGMYSKLLAAKKAVSHGIGVNILSGKRSGILESVLCGEGGGTYFVPGTGRLSQRKGWIAYSIRTKGSIIIDEGAVKAIGEMNRSLLPSGIVSVEGSFEVGDAVYCEDGGGRRVAKGLTNYSSADLRRIKGKKTSEIEEILGYRYSDEAIHRDNMVILKDQRSGSQGVS